MDKSRATHKKRQAAGARPSNIINEYFACQVHDENSMSRCELWVTGKYSEEFKVK